MKPKNNFPPILFPPHPYNISYNKKYPKIFNPTTTQIIQRQHDTCQIVVFFLLRRCVSMKFILLTIILVLSGIYSVESIGVTYKYFADDTCLAQKAERSFEQGECHDFAYDPTLLSATSCELAVECFSAHFENLPSCSGKVAINTTTILTGVTGVRLLENPNGPCSENGNAIVEEVLFGECVKSSIYQNCYFKVDLGTVVDHSDYYVDDDSSSCVVAINFFLGLVALFAVVF